MSELHPPVRILSKGWKRIEFPRRVYENDADSFTPIIPNDKLLNELIRIPQSLWYDPLEFQQDRNKFRNYSGLKKVEDWSKMGKEQVV